MSDETTKKDEEICFVDKKIKKILKETASRGVCYEDDDFNPMDQFGGNMDDAYWGGCQDGRVELARELLKYVK